MLSVRLPMVIFTDDESIVEHVYKIRVEYGLLEMTIIVRLPFEHTFFYKDLETLKQRMDTFHIVNWNQDKDTPLYILLNNNKFDFLQRAMEMNPFNSEFFLWMDMGIQHCTKATDQEWLDVSEQWPSFIYQDREHIHQLRIHTVTKPDEMPWKDYFRMIYHHVAGGLFGGYKDRVQEYIQLFKEQWHKILYEEEWWQLDEAIMTILTETFPEKFRFFYGDYDGLLSNFIKSKKSFELVFQTAQRHLNANRYPLVAQILDTLDLDCLTGKEYYERAINMMICADFYTRNGNMSPVLSQILNNHNLSTKIIQSQINNIRHFTDPNSLHFFVKWVFQNPVNNWAVEKWKNIQDKNNFGWMYLEKFSMNTLVEKMGVIDGLPVGSMDDDPQKLLEQFQYQFSSFPEKNVCSLYNILENEGNIFFLWNTPSFFVRETDCEKYDQYMVKLCHYLRRNFPKLSFYIVCLYTNRTWSIQEIPPELIVFDFETQYCLKQNDSFYTQSVSGWFDILRNL